jgi:signal transduction histidine kinase
MMAGARGLRYRASQNWHYPIPMQPVQPSWFATRSSLRPVIAAMVAAAIFIADTLTDLEIAIAALYVTVILLSVSFAQRRGVLLIGSICIALTVVSYALTRSGEPLSGGINCLISLTAIAATTYLVLRIEAARVAVYEARAQLAHVARVTTLGELTASIAHEVNQPLTAVVTNGNAALRWLASVPPNAAEAIPAINRIVKEANRASQIIDRIRLLARRAPPAPSRFNVNDTVLATLPLIQNQIDRYGISLGTQLDTSLPNIRCDEIQLQQVLLNLLVNAVESLAKVEPGTRELRLRTARSVDNVIVAVEDNGTGLSAELDRLFDAFYTTKSEGLGMGLAIARSIIEAHSGRIWAETRRPQGAIMQFSLPIPAEPSHSSSRD